MTAPLGVSKGLKLPIKTDKIEGVKGMILGAILAVTGLISLASLGAILLFIPPETDPILVPALLSLALFLALTSALTFLGRRLRRRYENESTRERILVISFREGVIVALAALGLLWLERFDQLTLWSAVGVAVGAIAIEYLFLLRQAYARG